MGLALVFLKKSLKKFKKSEKIKANYSVDNNLHLYTFVYEFLFYVGHTLILSPVFSLVLGFRNIKTIQNVSIFLNLYEYVLDYICENTNSYTKFYMRIYKIRCIHTTRYMLFVKKIIKSTEKKYFFFPKKFFPVNILWFSCYISYVFISFSIYIL